MGSACCVAARDHTLPNRTTSDTLHRNIRYSPSWSFRWDNRVAGEVGNPPSQYSHGCRNSGNTGLEIKNRMDVESREDLSDGGSPLENFQRPTWQKSSIRDGAIGNSTTPASDLSMGSSFSTEVKESIVSAISEPPAVAGSSAPKLSFSIPSTSMSMNRDSDPSLVHADSTPSRWARRSPGHQLFRGISDSRILGLKSPTNNSVSEGRQSFVLSTCSNDLTMGSQGGSSDGWSMRTFSELVASSQRDRWSFDSEMLDSSRGKITRSNSRVFTSPSIDRKSCAVCSKLLTERSSWSSQKIIATNELSVVAVLVCGHAYHAECLENMTPESERYDPSCPACLMGEKQALKISGKQLREADLKVRNNWISRNRVVDSDIDGNSVVSTHRKRGGTEGKGPKMGASSSMKNSFVKPFLRRHFSLGSKPTMAMSGNDLSARRKGFWARYH
ncbi:hypothetical protein AQUCO_00700286v1 [Aquilegia coerulea]|uniref:RING-type domain-containing protein n=3 Tax=Aquilegia coerulea TaxID=218851 RepID=A0A2G5EJB6_AQUCA|nr:hypothetical protein AQUCO_00700286v1 [Aquilegia coerulea]